MSTRHWFEQVFGVYSIPAARSSHEINDSRDHRKSFHPISGAFAGLWDSDYEERNDSRRTVFKSLRPNNTMHLSNIARRDLVHALRLRREIIADHAMRDNDPAAHLEALKSVSEQILAIQKKLPPSLEPRLAHYLDRCSYDKALALLEELSGGK